MPWHPGILSFQKTPVLRPFPTRNGKLHASILTADRRRDRPAHKDPWASHHSRKPIFSCGCPDPGFHHRAGCHRAPGFPRPNERFKTKRPAQGRLFDIRAAAPATAAQRRGPACSSEKSFFGVGWGPGGRKGQFLQQTPLPPAETPGKNHASTGRRASMAALSRTRWLELPRKSSSRSRNAST